MAPIFPTGEKSNACRTRLSCRLSAMECREPACPPSVRSEPRRFSQWFAICGACRDKWLQHHFPAIP